MRKILFLFAMALSLGFISCSGDDSNDGNAKDLGNGIYIINGHRFVDLGLPSGTLWAETNIGAEKASDKGDYFAWGETSTKSTFALVNYKFLRIDTIAYCYRLDGKYNEEDGKTTLDKEDDAAYVIWVKSCRMPTNAQFEELCQECSWTWTSKLGSDGSHTYGYAVKSKTNDNVIFLPAGGKIGTSTDENGEIAKT